MRNSKRGAREKSSAISVTYARRTAARRLKITGSVSPQKPLSKEPMPKPITTGSTGTANTLARTPTTEALPNAKSDTGRVPRVAASEMAIPCASNSGKKPRALCSRLPKARIPATAANESWNPTVV